MTFDEIRAAFPNLGIAAYALEPGGAVTVEIYPPDGQVYSFSGRSLADALTNAFPPEPPTPPPNVFD